MVERGVFEVACVLMAGRTSSSKMIRWGAVTGGTVRAADGGMVEGSVFEVARVTVASIT